MGDIYSLPIIELRPTQFAVGMRVVHEKHGKLAEMTGKERREYLSTRPIPVIVGPGSRYYMIDKHHMARSLWQVGEVKAVAKVVRNWSRYGLGEFWRRMRNARYVYLFDQFGNGPHAPDFLPGDVSSLADDPYRSLAKAVQREEGFLKSTNPFSEFEWANYFRRRISISFLRANFDSAVNRAIDLADDEEASELPGYIPPVNSRRQESALRLFSGETQGR